MVACWCRPPAPRRVAERGALVLLAAPALVRAQGGESTGASARRSAGGGARGSVSSSAKGDRAAPPAGASPDTALAMIHRARGDLAARRSPTGQGGLPPTGLDRPCTFWPGPASGRHRSHRPGCAPSACAAPPARPWPARPRTQGAGPRSARSTASANSSALWSAQSTSHSASTKASRNATTSASGAGRSARRCLASLASYPR